MSPRLKHAAADWCFLREGMDPAAYYRELTGLGYRAVEMVAPARRALARDAGLQLLTMAGPGMERGLNHREHHAELLPMIRQSIAEAAEQGVAQVILFSGSRRGQSDADGIGCCVDALRALSRDAVQARVGLLLEVLGEVDHPDYHASRMSFAQQVVAQVDSPAVRILYDLYHATNSGDDVAHEAIQHLHWIGHLHVASCERRSRPRSGQRPDYPRLAALISQAGYDGHWGHEFIPGEHVLDELRSSLQHLESPFARHPG